MNDINVPMRLDRRFERTVARSVLLIAGMLACGSAPAQENTPAAAPYRVVNYDRSRGAIESYAPFDEDFIIQGTASPELQEVRAYYCTDVGLASKIDTNQCAQGPIVWQRSPDTEPRNFNILVPALRAQRKYRILLVYQSRFADTSLAAYRSNVASLLDRRMRALPASVSSLPDDSLRAMINAAVQDALPAGSVVPSGFMAIQAGEPAPGPSKSALAEVLSIQSHRGVSDAAVESGTAMLQSNLKPRQDAPVFERVAAYYESLSDDSRTDIDRAGSKPLFTLASLSDVDAIQISSGRRPMTDDNDVTGLLPMLTISEQWTSAELDKRYANLTTTANRLEAARRLLIASRTRKGVIDSAKVSREELDRAIELVGKIRSSVYNLQRDMTELKDNLDRRQSLIASTTKPLDPRVISTAQTVSQTEGSITTDAGWYVGADVGVTFLPAMEKAAGYIGANFYFTPVNKRVPIGLLDFGRRFSLSVGATYISIAEDNRTKDLLLNFGLLLGAGYRFTDALRLGGGILTFYRRDYNPFVDSYSLATSPYVSVSLDWDIASTLSEPWGIASTKR